MKEAIPVPSHVFPPLINGPLTTANVGRGQEGQMQVQSLKSFKQFHL